MTGSGVRVVIADDEPLIRAGIRLILTSDPGIEVVAEAPDGRAAIELTRAHAPDVVLLDIQMPVMDGLTALAELRRTAPGTPVIILTTFGERDNVLRALESGGAGFLLKDTAPAELIGAVRAAAAGEAYLSPAATRHVVDQLASGRAAARGGAARARVDRLSDREHEVLALLGEGLSNADTGRRLHMSEATVKTYVSRILAKLECENRVQAALLARDAGLGT
ncbi:response regulator transcription factor [Streptomyces uncialis]|uniref:LuxR family transcriptional regulator n=1 Tax=Streptomyces uncialis TaxID=1048205 RepID=A0A1Q4V300_9ACTN|nr:response regulator transcription factor [Streptomyces uncialis]MCX4657797.1 response regulator transcription factor [Streptomyces uncialis]OKH92252.1 LuxR family transcriptional regulator [Streptomyces uncialis]WTE15228.1 response regulator transcription factor [Streptomyces uncialis]